MNDQVNYLYGQVKIHFDEYDGLLRDKENKMTEIGKDFFSKIFYKKHSDNKNKIIGGVEMMPGSEFGDYSVADQINFTCDYIERLDKLTYMGETSGKVKKYLECYKMIMGANQEQLGDETFAEYVARITA